MPLSTNAERTLEQVKSGLSILYGADYFNEDEWVKIDALIHKGKYVFTSGPRSNILDEELITFDEFQDTILPPAKAESKDAIIVTETQISTPPTSKEPSLDSSESIPNGLSAEASTDEAQPTKLTPEQRIIAPPPPNGGLALGYTQAQLDEVKAFNAGLTRAGQKSKPKITRKQSVDEEFYPAEWLQEPVEEPSPTLAEQESRINSWASEVHPEVSPPAVSQTVEPAADDMLKAIETFKKLHGRSPKSANDVYQPRNPNYKGPKRPDSRASAKTATSAIPKGPRQLYATSGNVFFAYGAFPKRSNITIEVLPGDTIQYIKHVSGIMHTGTNLRTKEHGQFPETVLEPSQSQAALIQQQRSLVQGIHGRERRSTVASSVTNSLDRVESMNAAEWEKDSDISSRPAEPTTKAGTFAPMPVRANAGLAGSRFANLADSSDSGRQSMTQAEIRKIIREELAHGKSKNSDNSQLIDFNQTPAPTDQAITSIVPKTTTCWFWKHKKDCRFTAEECIHLHADIPDDGTTTNLRLGKPTWGAIADTITESSPTISSPRHPPHDRMHPSIQSKHFNKVKTCYYWATDGKCTNTAVDCKYLHEYTEAGVAYKPGGGHSRKRDFDWSKGRSVSGAGAGADGGDGTANDRWGLSSPTTTNDPVTATAWGLPDATSADLLANPNAAIWGAVEGSSAWDTGEDKYKPPHIKAIEERERIDAVGW